MLEAGLEQIAASETYQLAAAFKLNVSAFIRSAAGTVVVRVQVLGAPSGDVILHWGVGSSEHEWQVPTEDVLLGVPNSTLVAGAAQSVAKESKVTFELPLDKSPNFIQFVVHVPPKLWIKNGNSNFVLPLEFWLRDIRTDRNAASIRAIAQQRLGQEPMINRRWRIDNRTVIVSCACANDKLMFLVITSGFGSNPILHWGFVAAGGWKAPESQHLLGASNKSKVVSKEAMETEFAAVEVGCLAAIEYSGDAAAILFDGQVATVSFVIRDGPLWVKDGNSNFIVDEIPLLRSWQDHREAFAAAQLRIAQKEKEEERRKEETWRRNLGQFRKMREDKRREFEKHRDNQNKSISVGTKLVHRQPSVLLVRRMSTHFALHESSPNNKSNDKLRVLGFKEFSLEDNFGELQVVVEAELLEAPPMKSGAPARIHVYIQGIFRHQCVLHWALLATTDKRRRHDWVCPPAEIRPIGTVEIDPARAVQTPFVSSPVEEPVPSESTPERFRDAESSAQASDPRNSESEFHSPISTSSADVEQPWTIAALPMMSIHLEFPATLGAMDNENVDDDEDDLDGDQKSFFVQPNLVGSIEPWGITAVVKCGDRWLHSSDGRDIEIGIARSAASVGWRGSHPEVAEEIVEAEAHWGHMTLMHRFNLMSSVIDKWNAQRKNVPTLQRQNSKLFFEEPSAAEMDDVELWAWLQTWARFSQVRLLDWQRNFNTKPRDLAVSTAALTLKVAGVWIDHAHSPIRPLVRSVLAMLNRGGDRGQQIRDEILVIMHKHHIGEQNHHMYEQWHQKLHNNSTPDDVGICSALIAYLRSNGDMNAYWHTLHAFGLSAHRLASYERPIRVEPHLVNCDRGELIRDLERYLDILKDVHDALDLHKAFDYAKPYLSQDAVGTLGWAIHVAQQQNDAHQTFQAVTDGRRMCHSAIRDAASGRSVHGVRELLFLDFALETQQSLAVQRMGGPLDYHHGTSWRLDTCRPLVKQLSALVGACSFHRPADQEARAIVSDWQRFAEVAVDFEQHHQMFHGQQREAALLLMSLVDRVSRWVGSVITETQELIGPKCDFMAQHILGPNAAVDHPEIPIFVEELLRGSALFGISVCLRRIEPAIRAAAEVPPWQLISVEPREVFGRLKAIDKLMHVQDTIFTEPTVLLSGAVSGEEEIPEGVVAVIVRSGAEAPDILSHVAVRARNSKVPLSVCYDPEIIAKSVRPLLDQFVRVTSQPNKGSLDIARCAPPDVGPSGWDKPPTPTASSPKREFDLVQSMLNDSDLPKSYVIPSSDFSPSTVGSKSLNLAALTKVIDPTTAHIPRAVALPYGAMQKAIFSSSNRDVVVPKLKNLLGQLKPNTSHKKARRILDEIKSTIIKLNLPPELADELKSQLTIAKFDGKSSKRPEDLWDAIVAVWASLFSLRPWISLRKANRDFSELSMAVLGQELVPAACAFVLHSRNPFGSNPNEMYGEMVMGLGETLVGNYAGRALSWSMVKDQEPKILSFFSKSIAISSDPTLIFRSDSNGEDLDGFAGAGLFESVTVTPPIKRYASYHNAASLVKSIVGNRDFRQMLLTQVGKLAFEIGTHFPGGLVDVEGVVVGRQGDVKVTVVQARPQV